MSVAQRILYHLGDACLTVSELAMQLDMTNRQISNGAGTLIARGLLERRSVGCFRLTASGSAAVRAGVLITPGPIGPNHKISVPRGISTLRQRAWNVMAMQRVFTVRDLVTVAARPGDKVPVDNLHRYCKLLARHGYLRVQKRRQADGKPTSNGLKVYEVVSMTGPVAPSWSAKLGGMVDHNTGKVVGL